MQNENNVDKKVIMTYILFFALLLVLIIALIPIYVVAPYGRATADDFGYSILTHRAWQETHSIWNTLKASLQVVLDTYRDWQGTFFTVFLFSLQPELFGNQYYVITPFVMLILWFGSTQYLIRRVFVKIFHLSELSAISISICLFLIEMEYIPRIQSAIFWWNGSCHYMVPFALYQFFVGLILKCIMETKQATKVAELVLISFLAILLGGSNYQAAMLSVLTTIILLAYRLIFIKKRERGLLLFIIPMVLGTISLMINILSPGNTNRAGDEFAFSLERVIYTIFQCFPKTYFDLNHYVFSNPVLVIALILLQFLMIALFLSRPKTNGTLRIPGRWFILLISVLMLFSMEAPVIFSDVKDATSGPYNNMYLFFIGVVVIFEMLIADMVADQFGNLRLLYPIAVLVVIAGAGVLILVPSFRACLHSTVSCISYDYVESGQADDFRAQMEEITRVLEQGEGDVVVLMTNPEQGPLAHMAFSDRDTHFYSNYIVSKYYGLDSIIGMYPEDYKRYYEANP